MTAFRFSRRAVLLVFAGFVTMLVHLSYSYWAYQFQEETITLLTKGANIQALPANWETDLTPECRVKFSTEIARTAFHDHGRLQSIFDLSGVQQAFVPTPKDLQEREERVVSLARLKAAAESTALVTTRIAITTMLVALFGFVFGRAKIRTKLPP